MKPILYYSLAASEVIIRYKYIFILLNILNIKYLLELR